MSHLRQFDPEINYYEILDVPYTATRGEITRSYRQLMRATHPDRFKDESDRKKAEERAKLINAAYSVLSKPEVRRDYDAAMRSRLINDALFQRYTGNVPGHHAARAQPRTVSSEMRREQRRAHRSALTYFLVFVVIFVGVLILLVVLGSVIAEVARLLIG